MAANKPSARYLNRMLRFASSTLFSMLVGVLTSSLVSAAESNELAPSFTLPRLNAADTLVSLSDYQGSYVLVDFWAAWCPPCRESLPAYQQLRQRLHTRFGAESFEVLAINVDMYAQEGRDFVAALTLDYPLLREETGATQRAFNLLAMPTAFLISPQGYIEFYYRGFSDDHVEKLEQALIERLTESPAQ